MHNWLLKKDDYCSEAAHDSFIDKSLLSVLGVLARVRRGGEPGNGFYYQINPTAKFIFSFLMILFVSLSRSFHYVLLSDAIIFLSLGLLELKDIRKTAVVTFTVSIFSAVILLPSALTGSWNNSLLLFLKLCGSVTAVNILANSSKWGHITRSMRVFRIPDIFILVLDITMKYIVILGEFSIHMLYALRLRSVGVNKNKYRSFSNLIGGLFLKSKEMAGLTYAAMECRGFDGHYTMKRKFHLKPVDFIFIFANSFILLLFFVIPN